MRKKIRNAITLLIAFVGLLIVIILFRSPENITNQNAVRAAGIHEIHPRFQEFHKKMGGTEFLGDGISPLFTDSSGNEYQYVMNALMMYSPNETMNKQYLLAALGMDIGVTEPPQHEQNETSRRIRNGHEIPEQFLDSYYNSNLQGNTYAGEPISAASYYEEDARLVQFYENVGLYIDMEDTDARVKLLPYGLWMCAEACGFTPENGSLMIPEETEDKVPLGERLISMITGEDDPEYVLFAPIAYGDDVGSRTASENESIQITEQPSQENALVPVEQIDLKTWTTTPLLRSNQSQSIMIGLFLKGKSLVGYATEVRVWMPDGKIWKFFPDASDIDGRTRLVLNPINAPNGTRIVYQVCPAGANKSDQCLTDDFLIWEN